MMHDIILIYLAYDLDIDDILIVKDCSQLTLLKIWPKKNEL